MDFKAINYTRLHIFFELKTGDDYNEK